MRTKQKNNKSNIIYLDKSCKTMSANELREWLGTICTQEQVDIMTYVVPLLHHNMLIGYDEKNVFVQNTDHGFVLRIEKTQDK
jgi:hypothetical protein